MVIHYTVSFHKDRFSSEIDRCYKNDNKVMNDSVDMPSLNIIGKKMEGPFMGEG